MRHAHAQHARAMKSWARGSCARAAVFCVESSPKQHPSISEAAPKQRLSSTHVAPKHHQSTHAR
eukprot:9036314-Lingulodinium_polyedra.AAC.1